MKMTRHSQSTTTTLMAVMICCSCAATREALHEVGGTPDVDHRRTVVLIDPTRFNDTSDIARTLIAVADDTVDQQGSLRVAAVTEGAHNQLDELPLDDTVHGGDFRSSARNRQGWRADAAELKAAFRELVPAMISAGKPSTYGLDLVGLLERAERFADSMATDGDVHIVMITRGGVQQSDAIDLLAPDVADVTSLADTISPSASTQTTIITLIGTGNFDHVAPPVDSGFVEAVASFWDAYCLRVGTPTRSCSANLPYPAMEQTADV